MEKNSGRLSTGRKNRGVISRQFRRLNISLSDNLWPGEEGEGRGQGLCVVAETERNREGLRERVLKLTGLILLRSHFFLLLNFNTIYFSFLFDVQCSHTLLECHKTVFKWTTNPCSCNRKTLTHAGRLSSSSISTVKSS